MTSPSPQPTTARVDSLAHWSTFFHSTSGIFRYPSTEGETIEHLDIDLRFVEHDDVYGGKDPQKDVEGHIHLPRVCRLTLRGGEYVQDHEGRMDRLSEVLAAINPVEVQWLNASNDPSEQLTFATHLIHPAIIVAGEIWGQTGLRKLVLEGGFPCPNLTAPTPYSQTPSATPLPSPRPTQLNFGEIFHAHSASSPSSPGGVRVPHTPFSGLPALSSTKPKAVDPEKLKAREERKRLADYSLKPRFEFAFGSWGAEEWRWRLDGKYTPACITSIITHWIRAIGETFPSPTNRTDNLPLPSLVTFSPIPAAILSTLQELPVALKLDQEVQRWLADVVYVSLSQGEENRGSVETFVRLFNDPTDVEEDSDRARQARQLKAEMLLVNSASRVEQTSDDLLITSKSDAIDSLAPPFSHLGISNVDATSPSISVASLTPAETEGSSGDSEEEAMTPEMGQSIYLRSANVKSPVVPSGKTIGQGEVIAPLLL